MYRSIFLISDHCIKQVDSMLSWVCSVIDHRGRQNMVKTSVTLSPTARRPPLEWSITEQTHGNIESI